jgi:hypothetical protein
MLLTACNQPNVAMTQLQIRQMQTRSYAIRDPKRALKAVLNVLQDEAYIPRQVDLDLGYIHAVKEVDVTNGNQAFWAKFWHGRDARWRKNSILDCAANVTVVKDGMRLRVNFQVKIMNNKGEMITVQAIEDPAFYQSFLQKVDKGVFLQKQGL